MRIQAAEFAEVCKSRWIAGSAGATIDCSSANVSPAIASAAKVSQ